MASDLREHGLCVGKLKLVSTVCRSRLVPCAEGLDLLEAVGEEMELNILLVDEARSLRTGRAGEPSGLRLSLENRCTGGHDHGDVGVQLDKTLLGSAAQRVDLGDRGADARGITLAGNDEGRGVRADVSEAEDNREADDEADAAGGEHAVVEEREEQTGAKSTRK